MIIIVLLILGFKPFAAAADPLDRICSRYTATSTYQANLGLLSTTLPKDTSSTPTLFARGSVGAAPDTVYGLALCRSDANASDCGSCVAAAFQDVQRLCPLRRDAHVLYETCILHFSGQDFVYRADHALNNSLRAWEKDPGWNPGTSIITLLLYYTARNAAYNSTTRYATGRIDVGSTFSPLYSTTQCTPDLPQTDCWDCLEKISKEFKTRYYTGQQGGRIAGVWCIFRYSTFQFYKGQPMMNFIVPGDVAPTTNTTAPLTQRQKRRVIKVLVIATVVPLLASFFCFIFCFRLIKRHIKGKVGLQEGQELVWGTGGNSEYTFFNFLQVSDATSNFSDENKLGQGGFGPVYKPRSSDKSSSETNELQKDIIYHTLLNFSRDSFLMGQRWQLKDLLHIQGKDSEFQNEVQLWAKLQHTNLVRLLGCCSQGEEKILIYEYLPNKSLDFFIFDQTKRALLNWNKRLMIIDGIAQGLLYLHEHSRLCVVHRDLKASNILLDSETNPKISDFGLAKIFNSEDTEGNTKRIAGTYGYMAPEYASEGLFSIKSDVFSFGVLILEIVGGKRNSCFHEFGDFFNLLGYAWKLWKEERWLEFIDASILLESHALETMRCINIALLCVQENAADRPTTSTVVAMLSSESMTLPEPKHPAYFHIRVTTEEPSSVNDVTMSALRGR